MRYFLFVIIFIKASVFSQNSEVFYDIEFKKYFIEKVDLNEIKDSNVKASIESINNSFSQLDFNLVANKNAASFSLIPYMDSEKKTINPRSIFIGGGNGYYYSDRKKDSLYHQYELFDKTFIVRFPLKRYDWVLHKESKIIKGFYCYKATAVEKINDFRGTFEINIEAWYTLDIPLNFGPADYSGLPGLILEAGNGKVSFRVTKIEQIKNKHIEPPKEGTHVTQEEIVKIFNEGMKKIRRQ